MIARSAPGILGRVESLTFYRLLASLAAGGLFAVAVVPSGEVALGFFRFSGLLYAGLVAAALAAAPGLLPPSAGTVLLGAAGLFALLAAVAPARVGMPCRRRAFDLAAFAGLAGAGLDGLAAARAAGHAPALGIAAALLSALLLGSALSAMVLGHWYLVMPRLAPDPLVRLTRLYAASAVLRAAIIAAALALVYAAGGRTFDRFLEGAGFFLYPRVLFGIVGPLVLAAMAVPTARARDTQPATGMLYVACVLVLVGEGIGHYLAVRTGVPL